MRTDPETELSFEEVGDERTVGVHFDAIEAGVGDHDGGDAPDNGIIVGRHVDAEQLMEACYRVVLVDAVRRTPVADEVLRACRHAALPSDERSAEAAVRWDLALESGDDGRHLLDELGVPAEALVASAPPCIPTNLLKHM